MASEGNSIPVNGNYAPHQGYTGLEQQSNYTYSGNAAAVPSQAVSTQQPPTSSTPAAGAAQADIPKDEVGWYFVEQYYTTLSRSPERLYLFYNKRSQFVSGQETDKVPVCLGQRAINERIKELDFQDCKVRVTNVDSQASDSNIVIQVIGEISNKSQPHKKFAQTFVLATQTNGYFVLNDIFRYLIDEEEEPEPESESAVEEVRTVPAVDSGFQEPPPTAAETVPETLTSSADPGAIEHDAKEVDKQIEEKALPEQSAAEEVEEPTVNGIDEEEVETKPVEEVIDAAEVEPVIPEPVEVTNEEPEAPKEPEPTPSPPKQATPQPAPAPKPAAPKTWASMAAAGAGRVATPAAPVMPATPAVAAPAQTRPTPPSGKTTTPPSSTPSVTVPPAAPSGPAAQRDESPADASTGDEWNTVGGGHNRQQSRQTNMVTQDGPITRAYIKNVHEGIDYDDLKSHLSQYGELVYYDIGRPRNAAFVEFRTPEGFNAAVAANPHNVGGDRLYVEERRTFVPRGQFQGSRGRGSGANQGQQRGNFQGRGGNNYTPRGGRGNATQTRGRGGTSQAA